MTQRGIQDLGDPDRNARRKNYGQDLQELKPDPTPVSENLDYGETVRLAESYGRAG